MERDDFMKWDWEGFTRDGQTAVAAWVVKAVHHHIESWLTPERERERARALLTFDGLLVVGFDWQRKWIWSSGEKRNLLVNFAKPHNYLVIRSSRSATTERKKTLMQLFCVHFYLGTRHNDIFTLLKVHGTDISISQHCILDLDWIVSGF